MSGSLRLARCNSAALGAVMTAVVILPGTAQSQSNQAEDSSRGVRIIDAPTPPPGSGGSQDQKTPGVETPSPPLLTPAAPSPIVAVPTLPPPAVAVRPVPTPPEPVIGEAHPALVSPPALRPSAEVPPVVPPVAARPNSSVDVGASVPAAPILTPPSSAPAQQPLSRPGPNEAAPLTPPPGSKNFADLPKQPDSGLPPAAGNLAALSGGMKIPNTAGLAMQILPGPDIAVGSQVSFQISSKKAGYLILVDVDATGKLAQIYPNPMSLTGAGGVRENSNFLRPGKPFRIPERTSLYSGFEFIASPPSGTAMVVAILSDRPVQRIDLPDVPVSLLGRASAVEYLAKLANELRIPDASGNGRLEEARWSFDAKFYAIR
jgi:uncharacterized protein DUF4384